LEPAFINGWLPHSYHLCTHAPDGVGSLLGLLRQCPGATAVIPALLEHVPLSRRQRQALEAALHTPAESTTAAHTLFAWEDLPHWPLGRLLGTLADIQRPAGTAPDVALMVRGQDVVALGLVTVGLVPR